MTDEAAQFPAQFAADGAGDVLDGDGAVALLSVSAVTVRKLAAAGKLPARKVGRAWRFHRPTLMRWLEGDAAAMAPEKPQEPRTAPVVPSLPSRTFSPSLWAAQKPGTRSALESQRTEKRLQRERERAQQKR